MSFSFDDQVGWGAPSPQTGDIIQDALKKEKVIKEIIASQEDLRVLLERVKTTQKEINKLTSDNEVLQMYIDNLTVQMAKGR
ncbi:hypothetical protein ONZ45_g11325 [Pleurotus djamor]|nr:hypothetical protein ONZ45_g11325 [Pleurotus djamor]